MTLTAPPETWTEVDDPELARDDVPVTRDISTRRLLGLQLLVFAVAALVALGLSLLDLRGGSDGGVGKVLETGAKLASAAVALSIVDRLGWYRRVGLTLPRRWNRLWLAWLPAAYVAFALAGGTHGQGVLTVLGVMGLSLAVGLEEELWTRGLVLESLRWRGTTVAVVVSSLWFGLLHSLNLLSGQPASATLAQMGFATAFGLAVGAVRVRVGTLWLPIALHALYDLGLLLADSAVKGITWRQVLAFLAVAAVPLAVYGLVLARPSKVPGPDGRMRRRRVRVEPWVWPEASPAGHAEAANVLGRWPAPPPQLLEQWYRR
ncbi:MAG: CPBP family intramembrane glutamic endopeptidase [Acidimicrobiales bacterium]